MKHIYLLIVTILFIQHCEPYIVFDNPQPAQTKNSDRFDNKYTGTYLNEDNVKLCISQKMIMTQSTENFDISKEELDTMQGYKMEGNFIIGPIIDTAQIIEIKNDTIFGTYTFRDTIFHIGNNALLKKYRKNYVLNMQRTDKTWEIILLSLNNNQLEIRSISKEYDLDFLKQHYYVEEVINDSTQKVEKYIIHTNKKEFTSFIKSGGFKEIENWVRITD